MAMYREGFCFSFFSFFLVESNNYLVSFRFVFGEFGEVDDA